MPNFLNTLNRNPRGWGNLPGPEPEVAYQDDADNLYGFGGAVLQKGRAPTQPQSLGEDLIGLGTLPARFATMTAQSLSPYGEDGWQVPPMLNDAKDAMQAPGELLFGDGLTREESERTASLAAGLMMGGGLVAPRPGNALARGVVKPSNAGFEEYVAKAMKQSKTMNDENQLAFPTVSTSVANAEPIRAYRGVGNGEFTYANRDYPIFATKDPDLASDYAMFHGDIDGAGAVYPLDMNFKNPLTVDALGSPFYEVPFDGGRLHSNEIATIARQRGHDGVIYNNLIDPPGEHLLNTSTPKTVYAATKRGTVKSATTGETLFSNGSKGGAGAGIAEAAANSLPNLATNETSKIFQASRPLEDLPPPMLPQVGRQEAYPPDQTPDLSLGQQAQAPRRLIENDPYLKAWADHLGLDYDGLLSPAIARAATDDNYKYLGIRSTENPLKVGKYAPNSWQWDRDVPTSEMLSGPSAVGLKLTSEGVAEARKHVGQYWGDNVSLLGAQIREYGQDAGEWVLPRAKVLQGVNVSYSQKLKNPKVLFSNASPTAGLMSLYGSDDHYLNY